MRKYIFCLLFILCVDVYAQVLDSTIVNTPTEAINVILTYEGNSKGASIAAEFNGNDYIRVDRLTNDQWNVINNMIRRYQNVRGDTYVCHVIICYPYTIIAKYVQCVIIEYTNTTTYNWWAYRAK